MKEPKRCSRERTVRAISALISAVPAAAFLALLIVFSVTGKVWTLMASLTCIVLTFVVLSFGDARWFIAMVEKRIYKARLRKEER